MNLQHSSIWLWECHTTSTSPCYGLHSSEWLLPHHPSPAGTISYRKTGLFVFQFFMAGFNHLVWVFSYLLPCFVSSSATLAHTFWSITSLLETILIEGSGILHSRKEHSVQTLPFLLFLQVKLRYVPLALFVVIWADCLGLVGWTVMGGAPSDSTATACYLLLEMCLMEFWVYLWGMLEESINWGVDWNVLSPHPHRRRKMGARCEAWGRWAELRGQGGGAGG